METRLHNRCRLSSQTELWSGLPRTDIKRLLVPGLPAWLEVSHMVGEQNVLREAFADAISNVVSRSSTPLLLSKARASQSSGH